MHQLNLQQILLCFLLMYHSFSSKKAISMAEEGPNHGSETSQNEVRMGDITESQVILPNIGLGESESGMDAESLLSGEVDQDLEVFGDLISESDYGLSGMTIKNLFTSNLTNSLLPGLCKEHVMGEPGLMASSKLVQLHSVNVNFTNATDERIKLNCDYSGICDEPTILVLGRTLKLAYDDSYQCGIAGSDTCTGGACIGAASYKDDLFDFIPIENRLTDVVSINLYDSQSVAELGEFKYKNLSYPLELQIPLGKDSAYDLGAFYYSCRMWDILKTEWTSKYCSEEVDLVFTEMDVSYAVCQCYRLGAVTVVAGERREPVKAFKSPTGTPPPTVTPMESRIIIVPKQSIPSDDDDYIYDVAEVGMSKTDQSRKAVPGLQSVYLGVFIPLGVLALGGVGFFVHKQFFRKPVEPSPPT